MHTGTCSERREEYEGGGQTNGSAGTNVQGVEVGRREGEQETYQWKYQYQFAPLKIENPTR
jgi:hypothetical protein